MSAEVVDVLVVGAGLAGARCAESLRSFGYDGSILVAGDEAHMPYERPALSKELLSGARAAASLAQRPAGFWAEQRIAIEGSAPVTAIDLPARTAMVGERRVGWRNLVVATGARARRLPGVPELAGVHHLRSLDDAEALRADLRPGARLVVIGAGFIGAEIASTARALGLDVAMIEEAPIPLARALGDDVGLRMAARIRAHRVDLRLSTGLRRLLAGGGRVRGVELGDGESLPCDAVVIGVGAVPNSDIASLASLGRAEDGGFLTDARGRTTHPDVFACGDVASAWRVGLGRHARREHWTAASAGARAVAAVIAGVEPPREQEPFFWSDQFGWRLQMIGEPGSHLRAEFDDDGETGFLVRYRDAGGSLRACLAVNRPEALGSLRTEMRRLPPEMPPAGGSPGAARGPRAPAPELTEARR